MPTPPAEHQFKPGLSGNPNGRPPGKKSIKDLVRVALEGKAPARIIEQLKEQGFTITDGTWDEVVVATNVAKAAQASIQHAKEIWDRRDGKANQDVNLTGEISVNANNEIAKAFIEKHGLADRA